MVSSKAFDEYQLRKGLHSVDFCKKMIVDRYLAILEKEQSLIMMIFPQDKLLFIYKHVRNVVFTHVSILHSCVYDVLKSVEDDVFEKAGFDKHDMLIEILALSIFGRVALVELIEDLDVKLASKKMP